MNFIGYQEHAAINTGNIDSSSSPAFVAVKGRLEINKPGSFYGLSYVLPIAKNKVTETWTINNVAYQTNDLSYTLTSVDIYSGFTINKMIEPLFGFRISRGEQTREKFYVNNVRQSTGQSIETINSLNLLLSLRGIRKIDEVNYGYSLEVLYPLNVLTTNTLLPAFGFSAAGTTIALKVNAGYQFSNNYFIKGEIGYRLIHYSGSGWTTQGPQQAQWPINDTQDLSVSAGLEF